MSGHQGEADSTVVQEDPRRARDQVRAEVEGVGLCQRDPEAIGIHCAQVGRVAVRDPGDDGTRVIRRTGHHIRRRRPVVADAVGRGGQSFFAEEELRLRPVVEDRRTVVSRRPRCLDDEVGPEWVRGVGPEADPFSDPGAGQCQVALGGRGNGPQIVPPDPQARRLAPLREVVGHIVLHIYALPELHQLVTELAAVEAFPPIVDDRPQRPGHGGEAHSGLERERAVGAELLRPRNLVDEMTRQRQHQGRHEPAPRPARWLRRTRRPAPGGRSVHEGRAIHRPHPARARSRSRPARA